MTGRFRQFRDLPGDFLRDRRGAAAVEMALVVVLLTIPLLNITDLGIYAYRRMLVENAAQAGAEEAWSFCNKATKLPATDTTKCPGFSTAVTNGVQSTSLTSSVTQAAGSPAEGYYCATTSGALQLVGTAGTVGSPPTQPSPDTCAAVAGASDPTAAPGDYVTVSVTYTFTSPFSGVSVASLLPSPITKTTMTRLN
jgi:Flp pilus assembly protein TadG